MITKLRKTRIAFIMIGIVFAVVDAVMYFRYQHVGTFFAFIADAVITVIFLILPSLRGRGEGEE